MTYLGIKFNKLQSFNQHIDEVESKLNRINGCLYPLINRKSELEKELQAIIYSTIIRPSRSVNKIEKLERIQSKALREAIKHLSTLVQTNGIRQIEK